MAAPEQTQPRRDVPRQVGLITRLYEIDAARENLQADLRRTRIAMLDTTSNPDASRLLEHTVGLGTQVGHLQMETAVIQALKAAGKPDEEIGRILTDARAFAETNFGQPPTPPSARSPHASSD